MPQDSRNYPDAKDAPLLFVCSADHAVKSFAASLINAHDAFHMADSGSEALEILSRVKPAILIAPLDAGDMSGFELCRKAVELSAGTLVILTGNGEGIDLYRKAMEAGAIRYVPLEELVSSHREIIVDCRQKKRILERRLDLLDNFERHSIALENLPFPALILDSSDKAIFINKAFRNITTADGMKPPPHISVLLGGLFPVSAWDPFFTALSSIYGWSGYLTCCREDGHRLHLHVILSALPACNGRNGDKLVIMRDVGREESDNGRLAIQRRTVFDLFESGENRESILDAILLSISRLASGGLTPEQEGEKDELTRLVRSLQSSEREQAEIFSVLNSRILAPANPFSLRFLLVSLKEAFPAHFANRNACLKIDIPEFIPDNYIGNHTVLMVLLDSLAKNAFLNGESEEVQISVNLKKKGAEGILLQFRFASSIPGITTTSFETMTDYITSLQYGKNKEINVAGLCLAIDLAEIAGGKVWVRSEAGRGKYLCFSITMPEAAYVEQNTGENHLNGPVSRIFGSAVISHDSVKPRVLLADDNEIDRLAIRSLLERNGYQVTVVSNGSEAVEEFDSADYVLVLMDILMPVMDGFEATRLIREKEMITGSHTPVYALTSYSLKAVRDKCMTVGMDGYLSKPLSAAEFSSVIDTVAEGESSRAGNGENTLLPTLDLHGAIENLGMNIELYREIIALFCSKAPALNAELLEAIRRGEREVAASLAHKLKGMASNIGALGYAEVTRKIQDEIHDRIPVDTDRCISAIETEFKKLVRALEGIDWEQKP